MLFLILILFTPAISSVHGLNSIYPPVHRLTKLIPIIVISTPNHTSRSTPGQCGEANRRCRHDRAGDAGTYFWIHGYTLTALVPFSIWWVSNMWQWGIAVRRYRRWNNRISRVGVSTLDSLDSQRSRAINCRDGKSRPLKCAWPQTIRSRIHRCSCAQVSVNGWIKV